MRLGEAQAPEGLRIYAIGDVHGCDDLLAKMHASIATDLASRPPQSYRMVHLGDFVDRGPDSAAVIERACRLGADDENAVFLRGNHESILLEFLATGDAAAETNFLGNGGVATLASYGIVVGGWGFARPRDGLAERLAARLPSGHRTFLKTLSYSVRFGDYFFCHAGVRPGVALDQQAPFDLTWIREEFLYSDADFGAVVVHGHTPTQEPEVRPNRINVDTGAVLGGPLTCLVLEGHGHRFLQVT